MNDEGEEFDSDWDDDENNNSNSSPRRRPRDWRDFGYENWKSFPQLLEKGQADPIEIHRWATPRSCPRKPNSQENFSENVKLTRSRILEARLELDDETSSELLSSARALDFLIEMDDEDESYFRILRRRGGLSFWLNPAQDLHQFTDIPYVQETHVAVCQHPKSKFLTTRPGCGDLERCPFCGNQLEFEELRETHLQEGLGHQTRVGGKVYHRRFCYISTVGAIRKDTRFNVKQNYPATTPAHVSLFADRDLEVPRDEANPERPELPRRWTCPALSPDQWRFCGSFVEKEAYFDLEPRKGPSRPPSNSNSNPQDVDSPHPDDVALISVISRALDLSIESDADFSRPLFAKSFITKAVNSRRRWSWGLLNDFDRDTLVLSLTTYLHRLRYDGYVQLDECARETRIVQGLLEQRRLVSVFLYGNTLGTVRSPLGRNALQKHPTAATIPYSSS